MNLLSVLRDPAAIKMRQAVRLFAESLLELAAEPGVADAPSAVQPAEAPAPTVDRPIGRHRAGTRSEEALPRLRELAGTMPVPQLARAVGLSETQLYRLSNLHNIRLGQVSQSRKIKIDELRQLAPTTALPDLAAHFDCSTSAIRYAARAHEIALITAATGRQRVFEWTDDRVALLKAKAGKVAVSELLTELGATRNVLFNKASELGLSLRWSAGLAKLPAWENQLATFAGKETIEQLEARFGCARATLYASAKRQGLSLSTRVAKIGPATTRPAKAPRAVTEVSADVDQVPSIFANGGWIEGGETAQAPAPALEARPVLEGISYSITTPDRSPPSPELIEALQPVVEAAAVAMRAQVEPVEAAADPSSALRAPSPSRGEGHGTEAVEAQLERAAESTRFDPVKAIRKQAASLRETDEEAGRAVAGFEPLPVERRRPASKAPAPYGRPRKLVQGAQKEGVSASKWVRLQHPDGKLWLRGDGLGWVEKRVDSYLCLRTQLPAAQRAFELARQCKVISEPAWTAKDISFSGAMR